MPTLLTTGRMTRSHAAFSLSIVPLLAAAAACDDHAEGVTAAEVTETEATSAEPAPREPSATRETLTIDPARSSVGFTGAKVTDSHTGTFAEFEGTIELDPDNPTRSAVTVTIQMASVRIEPERLLNHLKSEDFFDVENHPTATFTSTRIREGAEGTVGNERATHTVTGNLTLRGVTRTITFPAIVSITPAEVRARSEFKINRRDFDIVYPGMPDDLISDDVVIRFDIRAPRRTES